MPWEALDLLEGVAVVNDQRTVGVPDAQQQVTAVAGELDMGGGFAGHRAQGVAPTMKRKNLIPWFPSLPLIALDFPVIEPRLLFRQL